MRPRSISLLTLVLAIGATASAQQPVQQSNPGPWDSPTLLSDAPLGEPVRLAQSTEEVSRPAIFDAQNRPVAQNAKGERGLLQGVSLTADWLPRMDDHSLGRSTLSGSVSVGVPPFVLGVPLMLTPRAAIHLVDGPDVIDAPSQLHDLELSVGTFRQLGPQWKARGAVTVGVYGDEHSLGESDALRVSGVGLAIYDAAPGWQWVFGVAYLNRDDISIVPAVGVIRDTGAVRYELTMPRPRVLWRLPQDAYGSERGLYVAGELGGGAWAVQRDSGATDTLNLSRWGVLVGYESKSASPIGPATTRYELGYVFGRELEYANTGEEVSLDDSLIARVGWTY